MVMCYLFLKNLQRISKKKKKEMVDESIDALFEADLDDSLSMDDLFS